VQNGQHDEKAHFLPESVLQNVLVSKRKMVRNGPLKNNTVHSLRSSTNILPASFELVMPVLMLGALSTELFWQITIVDQVSHLDYVLGPLHGFAEAPHQAPYAV
jgi:hypothetical protein